MAKTPDTLPDTRAKVAKGGMFYLGQWWIPCFCGNCGIAGPFVPEENMNFAFWLCDKCYRDHGVKAGQMALPDELFWCEVNEVPFQSPSDLVVKEPTDAVCV